MTTPSLRSDVRRNRQALLGAARELFRQESDVPMYRIARYAGVGHATLYRHFPDRSLLAAALAEEALERLEADAPGQTLEAVLTAQVRADTDIPGLRRMMAEGAGTATLEASRERLKRLYSAPLKEAKRDGRVDKRITAADVLLLLQMLEGGLANAAGDDLALRRRLTPRALALALAALGPRDAK